MARINIDEEIFTDPRFMALRGQLSEIEAMGSLVMLWRLGQIYWKKKGGIELIPRSLFDMLQNSEILVRTSFVVIKENGIYCCGANERWGYLRNDQKVAAGKKSAESRRKKNGTAQPKKSRTTRSKISNDAPNETRTAPNEVERYSSPYSYSYSSKTEENPPSPFEENLNRLVGIWNENCGTLPRVIANSKSRDKLSKDRLSEEKNLDAWADVVKRIASSAFCCGNNERGWQATFDWLLKPDTRLRVLEGKYDTRSPKAYDEDARKKREEKIRKLIGDV